MTQFNRLLIANRGEIVCRIIRTARAMGIKTIAVFSEADSDALHVRMADEAFLIGKAPSKESYLNIEKIISIAKTVGATAIHPGYGFLSENAHFAKACEEAGIVFVGPKPAVIDLMANKNLAKEKMHRHGVPILPGYYEDNHSLDSLQLAAKKIGYPIVLKAVAGGGGKGLRLVYTDDELEQAYHAVKREAKAFFNDDKVLLEKYLTHARHIEVQILGDHYGNVQPILTRDCSIQRKHQKIIEEAPAPHLSAVLEKKILETAVIAAKAIHYTNAGTIEFLVSDEHFFFLEMNTRLQVEHPVTEMITGLDLVEWQLRIAAGEKIFHSLKKSQGHSIEARLNAEDPTRDFLPSSGKLHYFRFPPCLDYVRVDSGYEENDTVNIYYDSLLAKLVVWGENRLQAIQRLTSLLENIFILGIKTNLTLLKNILNHTIFKNSEFNTHFLQKEKICLETPLDNHVPNIAALFMNCYTPEKNINLSDHYSPWLMHDGWKLYSPPLRRFDFVYHKTPIAITVSKVHQCHEVKCNDEVFLYNILSFNKIKNDIYTLSLISNHYRYLQAILYKNQFKLELIVEGNHHQLEIMEEDIRQGDTAYDEQLFAPMPGTLVALLVRSGQKVNKGDKLLVIEAMKMEHTLYAPKDGIVKHCYYQIGDLIKEGAELIELE
jgi:3-methylcrotonyl-CoA carboxylase alpha subunit